MDVEVKKYNGCCPGSKDSDILAYMSCGVEGYVANNKKLEEELKAQGYSYDYEFDFEEIVPGKNKNLAIVYFFKSLGKNNSDRIR